MELSVIVVNYKTGSMTSRCIDSIKKIIKSVSYEIVIVDNHSCDSSIATLTRDHCDVSIIELAENYGYGKAVNIAFKRTTGEYILVLNSDIVIENDFAAYLINFYHQKRVGVIGIKLLKNNRFQKSFGYFPSPLLVISNEISVLRKINYRHFNRYAMIQDSVPKTQSVEWITGAFMFISRDNFEYLGGFDEHFFMFYEDIDLCCRCFRMGLKNYFVAEFHATHEHQASIKKNDILPYHVYKAHERESAAYYIKKYYPKYFPLFLMIYRLIFIQRYMLLTIKKANVFYNQEKLLKCQRRLRTIREIIKNLNY